MKIYGTYGDTVVEPYTGQPLKKIDIEEYADIARFDVEEYKHFYFGETYPPEGIDILDIGYWTVAGDYIPPDTTHRFAVYDHYVLVIEEESQKSEPEVYSFPADHDQPITCPKCGARSEPAEGDESHQICLGCYYNFTVEFEEKEDEPEEPPAMSTGVAMALLIDYARQDYEDLDESDLDDETRAYTSRVRYAMKVAGTWLDDNSDLYEQFPEVM